MNRFGYRGKSVTGAGTGTEKMWVQQVLFPDRGNEGFDKNCYGCSVFVAVGDGEF